MFSSYVDYNATTPLHPEIAKQMAQLIAENDVGNPSSLHRHGREARKIIEEARDKLAAYLQVDPAEVFFTSGGTESNNLVIQGLSPTDSPLFTGSTEHPSVLEPARKQWASGRPGTTINVDQEGRIEDLDSIEGGLISIQWVNNETGIAQDLPSLADSIHSKGGILHTDGAQGFFRLPGTINELAVDAASITAHKSFGPTGAGALWLRRGLLIDPVITGGGQEKKIRPGTENLLAIHGMGALAELASKNPLWQMSHLQEARDTLLNVLEGQIKFNVIHQKDGDWPGCINIGFADIHAETLLVRLDMVGISASSGSACSSGARELSHVLQAMQIDHHVIKGSIRISIGPDTSLEEIRHVADKIASIVRDLAGS